MAFFDQALDLQASPQTVSEAIKASISPDDQLIISRPDTLLIALRQNMGYVYLLRSQDNNTRLRLMVDSAQTVREAFRGKSPKEALTILAVPTTASALQTTAINEHLAAIKQYIDQPPVRSASPFSSEPEPVSAAPEVLAPLPSSADPEISAIFSRKPLPANGATSHLPAGSPWNPDRLLSFSFFFAPASGIALGLNWRQLGKAQWMLPTILLSIIVPAVTIGAVIGLAVLLPKAVTSLVPVLLILAGTNWGYIWGLWYLQRGAYKKWDNTGSATELLNYPYNLTNAGIVGSIVVLFFLVFGIVSIYLTTRPNTFDSPLVAITYPNTWRLVDVKQIKNCDQATVNCILVLNEARFGYTSIVFSIVTTPVIMSADEVERNVRSDLQDRIPDFQFDAREPWSVSGIAGYSHTFYFTDPSRPDETEFARQIFFIKNQRLFELDINSLNRGIFDEDWPSAQKFIDGIKLK